MRQHLALAEVCGAQHAAVRQRVARGHPERAAAEPCRVRDHLGKARLHCNISHCWDIHRWDLCRNRGAVTALAGLSIMPRQVQDAGTLLVDMTRSWGASSPQQVIMSLFKSLEKAVTNLQAVMRQDLGDVHAVGVAEDDVLAGPAAVELPDGLRGNNMASPAERQPSHLSWNCLLREHAKQRRGTRRSHGADTQQVMCSDALPARRMRRPLPKC